MGDQFQYGTSRFPPVGRVFFPIPRAWCCRWISAYTSSDFWYQYSSKNTYCGWNPNHQLETVLYPIIYWVSTIGGAGFGNNPSTVSSVFIPGNPWVSSRLYPQAVLFIGCFSTSLHHFSPFFLVLFVYIFISYYIPLYHCFHNSLFDIHSTHVFASRPVR